MKKTEQTPVPLSRIQTMLHLLAHLSQEDGLDMTEMIAITNTERRNVFRLLVDIERDFKVQVKYTRSAGRYQLRSWGVLEGPKVIAQYSKPEVARGSSKVSRKVSTARPRQAKKRAA